jgi:3-deoxy-D-manno-octulosonate 8-phosphate phosphatase (KDO 8-P phosphatase)
MLSAAAEKIELLILDVDGVLTDGSICIDDHGVETKRFHVRDGTGMRLWMKLGLQIAIITGRRGMALRHRCNELGVTHLLQSSSNKLKDFSNLLNDLGMAASQAAVVGDDLPDLPVMKMCGYPIAVADAAVDVRDAAMHVTMRPGGHGAVREAIEHLLQQQGRWDEAKSMFEAKG